MTIFTFQRVFCLVLVSGLVGLGGCGAAFVNATASLGGEGAGSRGSVDVIVINNTSYSAAYVLGTFDPGDPDFAPDVIQFGLDDIGLTLGPDSQSDAISFRCARVFSIGGRRLLDLVEASFDPQNIEQVAFVDGASFFDPDPEDADAESVEVGSASALEALLGVDFNCGSILIVRLEVNDVGVEAFRVDFEVIPSESGR